MTLSRTFLVSLILTTWCLLGVSRAALPSPGVVVKHARMAQGPPRDVDVTYMEQTEGAPSRRAFRVRARAYGALRLDTQDLDTGTTQTRVWLDPAAARVPVPDPTDPPRVPPKNRDMDAGPAGTGSTSGHAPSWIRWVLGEPIESILKGMEVDMSRISLDHDGAVILWVLGAAPAEDHLPQVHLERRSGVLRRLVELRVVGSERRPVVFTFDEPGKEPTRHVWPPGFTIRTDREERRFVIRRWVDQPVLPDAIFTEPAAQPMGKELR